MSTQQIRGASAVGSVHVQTLPRLPQIQPWLRANRPDDKTLIRFGEWFDEKMELWRQQAESSLTGNFNTIRLLKSGEGEDTGLSPEEVQSMIDASIEGIDQGDTIINNEGVTEDRVVEIVTAATATYIWNQASASAEWIIPHNLGRYPPVSVVDSGENVIGGDVQYPDLNTVVVTFAFPFSGKAYLG